MDLNMKIDTDINSTIRNLNVDLLGTIWPGIQLYYPPVKYSPSAGIYETIEDASNRMQRHAHATEAHTLILT